MWYCMDAVYMNICNSVHKKIGGLPKTGAGKIMGVLSKPSN